MAGILALDAIGAQELADATVHPGVEDCLPGCLFWWPGARWLDVQTVRMGGSISGVGAHCYYDFQSNCVDPLFPGSHPGGDDCGKCGWVAVPGCCHRYVRVELNSCCN